MCTSSVVTFGTMITLVCSYHSWYNYFGPEYRRNNHYLDCWSQTALKRFPLPPFWLSPFSSFITWLLSKLVFHLVPKTNYYSPFFEDMNNLEEERGKSPKCIDGHLFVHIFSGMGKYLPHPAQFVGDAASFCNDGACLIFAQKRSL